MRKVTILILIALAIGAFLAQGALAQTVSLEPANPTVAAGNTVEVAVRIAGLTNGLGGFRVDLSIPADCAAKIVDLGAGDFTTVSGPGDIAPDGKSVPIAGFTVSTGETEGTLGRVTFQGLSSGSSPCSIDLQVVSMTDDDGATISPTVEDGTLTVTGVGEEDTTPPGFSERQPPPGSTINVRQPTISAKITDASGIDSATIELTLTYGGTSRSFTVDSPGASWNGLTFSLDLAKADVFLEEGPVNVGIKATDSAGNEGNASWSFTVSLGAALTIEQAVAQHSGDPQIIDDADILWAVKLWIEGTPVPGTNGQVIDDDEIIKLVELWIEGGPVS